jgi:NAD(P)H-hydrate epimerase
MGTARDRRCERAALVAGNGNFQSSLPRNHTASGEAARLLRCTAGELQCDRPATLRELSGRFGNCWVVLKGHQTLIGRAEGELFVNSSGNTGLAQGGSGDLLAGFIAGWLAQPALRGDPLMALRYAVWEHGAAADRLNEQRENWIIEELAEELGRKRA